MDILVNVANQKLKIATNLKRLVAGTQDFIRFVFNLTGDWDGLMTFAQFRQNGKSYNQYLDENNSAYLPAEIGMGTCTLMLYGSNNNTKATTNYLTLTIDENTLVADANSTEISLSLYNQLVNKVNTLTNNEFVASQIEKSVIDELNKYLSSGQLAGLSAKNIKESPINKCYFNYYSGLVMDTQASAEQNAYMLARQNVVVSGADMSPLQKTILTKARRINSSLRAFRYISVHTQYDSFDVLKTKMQQMVSDGFQGVFFDEFDTNESLEAMQAQGNWNSVIEKQNALIDYAHSIGLNVFANPWLTGNMLSGIAGTTGQVGEPYNPDGIKSTLNGDDIVLFESNEWYPGAGDDTTYVYWSGTDTAKRIYDYKTKWYTEGQSPKAAVYCYGARTMTDEVTKRAATWILYNSLAIGCDYVFFSGLVNYDIPENIYSLYAPDSTAEIQRISDGVYKYTRNGHTLTTTRWAVSGTRVDAASLGKVEISLDGSTFQNAFIDTPSYSYKMEDAIQSVRNDLYQLQSDYKSAANPYVRMFIDDWIPKPSPDTYTNIIPNKKGTTNLIALQNVIDEDYMSFDLCVDNAWGGYWWEIDTEPFIGKTLEFGFEELTYSWGNTATNFWCSIYNGIWENAAKYRVFPTTQNMSKVGNNTGLCVQYTVTESDPMIRINFAGQGAPTGGIVHVKGLYVVDITEIKEYVAKDSYTNMVRDVSGYADRMNWVAGARPYVMEPSGTDPHSFTITFNEDNYQAWMGITLPLNVSGLFAPGSRWEFGCASIETNAGANIAMRIYTNRDGFFPWLNRNTKNDSEFTGKTQNCIPIVIPESKEDTVTSAYIELCDLSSKPYNEDAGGNKTYHYFTVKGLYLYNPNEENVIVRGETPANSWLQVARVTDKALVEHPVLQPNALYISNSGYAFLTDFNRKKHEISGAIYRGAVQAGYTGTPEEFGAAIVQELLGRI